MPKLGRPPSPAAFAYLTEYFVLRFFFCVESCSSTSLHLLYSFTPICTYISFLSVYMAKVKNCAYLFVEQQPNKKIGKHSKKPLLFFFFTFFTTRNAKHILLFKKWWIIHVVCVWVCVYFAHMLCGGVFSAAYMYDACKIYKIIVLRFMAAKHKRRCHETIKIWNFHLL